MGLGFGSKGCFLEVFKYAKTTQRDPVLEGTGIINRCLKKSIKG